MSKNTRAKEELKFLVQMILQDAGLGYHMGYDRQISDTVDTLIETVKEELREAEGVA